MNVQYLGLIGVPRTLDKNNWHYKYEMLRDGKRISIECRGDAEYGVPHGIDNDFYNGIIHQFIERGMPEDGLISTTGYELLKLAGKSDNDQNYRAMRQSLTRLYLASYLIGQAWRNNEQLRWDTVTFKHIDKLRFTSDEDSQLSNRSIIQITLPPEIVHSVRAGYILPNDSSVLRSLSQPTTRNLYRLLEARRRHPEDITLSVDVVEENLEVWGQTCKLFSDRPEKLRRSLENAHAELIEAGYLKSVEYLGRGMKQTVVYTCHPKVRQNPDKRKVQLLEKYGVFKNAARHYAVEYADWIDPVIQRYEALVARGLSPENPAGFIVKMLREPESFEVSLGNTTPAVPPVQNKATAPATSATAEVISPVTLEAKRNYVRYMANTYKKQVTVQQLDVFMERLTSDDIFAQRVYEIYYGNLMDAEKHLEWIRGAASWTPS